MAGVEAAQAATDLGRARTLLNDLVQDIAPVARLETQARVDLQAAIDAQAVRVAATADLGPVDNSAGARAVLAAAQATEASVNAQQAFHDAREQWAQDNLTPAETALNGVKAMKAAVDDDVAEWTERLRLATEACKSAAFHRAQEAREKAIEVAAARSDKEAEVLREYTAVSAFATEGAEGALCNFPPLTADGVQGPRPDC